MLRFEFFRRKPLLRRAQWYFRIKMVGNNEILAQSEGYTNYNDAINTAKLIKEFAKEAEMRRNPYDE